MTFRERMAFASKQRQTQSASPVAARNRVKKTPTTEQYRAATLERVLTKMKLMKETI